jgi:hypothetical protein
MFNPKDTRENSVAGAPEQDPSSALARSVIDLYTDELADVRFPDVDLARLQAAREELTSVQCELERCSAELERMRATLAAKAQALDATAERALAYARIYAEKDPRLSARIDAVRRARSPAAADGVDAPKRRGRRKKAETPSDLFSAEPPAVEHEARA